MITLLLVKTTCVSRLPGRVQPTIWQMGLTVTTMTQMAKSQATIQAVISWVWVASAA